MFKLGSKQKGLSLIEALLVLGLLAGLITLITQNFQEASSKQKVQAMNQEIFKIYTGVQSNFNDEDDGTDGLNEQMAYNLGIKPPTVKGNATTWKHGFEGVYELDENSNDPYAFNLTVTKVPVGFACTEIVKGSKKASWTHIGIGSSSVSQGDEVGEWSVGKIASDCNPSNADTVNVMFTYDPS